MTVVKDGIYKVTFVDDEGVGVVQTICKDTTQINIGQSKKYRSFVFEDLCVIFSNRSSKTNKEKWWMDLPEDFDFTNFKRNGLYYKFKFLGTKEKFPAMEI